MKKTFTKANVNNVLQQLESELNHLYITDNADPRTVLMHMRIAIANIKVMVEEK